LIDPFSKIFYGFARSDLAKDVPIARYEQLGKEEVSHQYAIDDQWHQPECVNDECRWIGCNVGGHHGFFVAQPMYEVLKSVSRRNGQDTHHERDVGAACNTATGNTFYGEDVSIHDLHDGKLQASVDKSGVEKCRDNGSRQTNDRSVGVDDQGSNRHIQGYRQLNGTPNPQTSGEEMT